MERLAKFCLAQLWRQKRNCSNSMAGSMGPIFCSFAPSLSKTSSLARSLCNRLLFLGLLDRAPSLHRLLISGSQSGRAKGLLVGRLCSLGLSGSIVYLVLLVQQQFNNRRPRAAQWSQLGVRAPGKLARMSTGLERTGVARAEAQTQPTWPPLDLTVRSEPTLRPLQRRHPL